MITDCHIHIQPLEMFQPRALELLKKKRPNFDQIVEFCRSPKSFLKYLDSAGVDRAVLINYVAPEVIGFTAAVNQFISDYTKENAGRLISSAKSWLSHAGVDRTAALLPYRAPEGVPKISPVEASSSCCSGLFRHKIFPQPQLRNSASARRRFVWP